MTDTLTLHLSLVTPHCSHTLPHSVLVGVVLLLNVPSAGVG